MLNSYYNVLIQGAAPGFPTTEVVTKLADLIGSEAEETTRRLSAANWLVIAGIDLEHAKAYRKTLEGVGALCVVEEANAETLKRHDFSGLLLNPNTSIPYRHVVIATQKPSAEVISTNLRSNLPAQLALRVKSATESRVVIDEAEADTLNGKGDALLKADGKLRRVQCSRADPSVWAPVLNGSFGKT